MRALDWFIVILAPILVFLIIALILWATWRPIPIPSGPTGITGFTGFTGNTGMTGPDHRSLIEQAIKHNLRVFPDIDPLSVVDITNLDCNVIILNNKHEIVVHGSHNVISHKTNGRIRRIIGFDEKLYAVDFSGTLWVLDCDLWDRDWDFNSVDEVNQKGSIVWINTTLDQQHLWITFKSSGGLLFDRHFDIIDTSDDSMYRIYGKTDNKYLVLNSSNHTLRLTNGYIYSNVSVAVLDCHNDLHTIPLNESPPLTGFRIVCGKMYILITLLKTTSTRNMGMQNMGMNNQMQNQMRVQNQMNNQMNVPRRPAAAMMSPMY